MAEATCPHCGASVLPEDLYCPRCTRSLRLPPQRLEESRSSGPRRSVGWVIAIGIVGMCALAGFPLLVLPMVRTQQEAAMAAMAAPTAMVGSCMPNLKQLATATAIYQADWDDRVFPSLSFDAELAPYTKNPSLFYCPQTGSHYAVNKEMLKVKASTVTDPSLTVLFYEGARQKLAFPHGNTTNIAFTDTSVKPKARTYKPKWSPK